MSIIQNKEIYDPKQGNPFKELFKWLEMLDKQTQETVAKMESLEGQIKAIGKATDGKGAKKLVELTAELNQETQELNKQNVTRSKINDQIRKAESQLVDLYSEEAQQLAEVRLELQQRRAELKKNAQANKVALDSQKGLEIQLSKLRKRYDELSKAERESKKVGGRLLKQIEALDKETKQVADSTGRFQKNVGDYPKSMKSAVFSTKNLVTNLKGLGRELLAAGGIVGGFQLLIDAGREFIQTSEDILDISKQLNASFALTESQTKRVATNIKAISDTFDQDYNDVLSAATAVSKELDISIDEATTRIEEGFLKGSNVGGEFLDILKEYPAQFRAAGIDAETTFAIINQTATEGIYSDKGIDAIKEAGLRLRENTKAVQESLAPLDDSVKAQIRQEVAAGRSFEAIKLVSEALNDTSLTAEETQSIVANVFGGAGEDAGLRYLQTLKDINTNLDDVKVTASESEEASLNLSKSWNGFVASVSSSDSIFTKVFSTFKNLLAGAVNSLTNLIELISGGDSASDVLAAKAQAIRDKVKQDQLEEQQRKQQIAAQEKIDEQERQKRFQAYQQREAERKRLRDQEIRDLNRKIEVVNREIAAIEKVSEKENEALLNTIENLEEEEEITIEFQDVALARQEQFEADKLAIQKEFAEKSDQIVLDSLNLAGEALGQFLTNSEVGFKSFTKSIVLLLLDSTEKFIQLSIARIFATEVAKGGFAGIAKATFLTGLVKGVFSGIKASIQNFAEGTESVQGAGTETSDSIPAMLSKNERVVPASINKQLGVSNDDLPKYVNAGIMALNKNSFLESLLEKNNEISTNMLATMKNGMTAYHNNGFLYIYYADGSLAQKIPQHNK